MKKPATAPAGKPISGSLEPGKPPGRYHHGALKEALLEASERVLERDGVQGLTLRAAAREAGVSHAAPKNHFDDLAGLLSELAARGFDRMTAAMRTAAESAGTPADRMAALGRGYVAFARAHPGLFLLMFRGERLDMTRPALKQAAEASAAMLSEAVLARGKDEGGSAHGVLGVRQAAGVVAAWSLVHGFSMLLLDGRLKGILAQLPEGGSPDTLLDAIFEAVRN